MQYTYKTKGTCSQEIHFEIEDGKLKNVQFLGGCNGNLKGIGSLVEGMDVEEVIARVGRHPLRQQGHLLSRPVGPGAEGGPSSKVKQGGIQSNLSAAFPSPLHFVEFFQRRNPTLLFSVF